MTAADIAAARYIGKNASEELARSQGRVPRRWQPALYGHMPHILRHDAGGSWIAEAGGLPVGYAQSILRGETWFLCQLFVQPEVQGADIGQGLLERAMQYGREGGARIYSVVSSTSPAAQVIYMRTGMYALGIGYPAEGPVAALLSLPEPDAAKKRVVACDGWTDRICALNREVWGDERRQDSEFWLSGTATPDELFSAALVRDGEFLGYVIANAAGWIGPLAAYDAADQLPLLRVTADWLAARNVEQARLWALSLNPTIMRAVLDAGWTFGHWTHFMASAPFGDFSRYLPSGGMML
jgi:GNAT superfamily N-acetyltransferase